MTRTYQARPTLAAARVELARDLARILAEYDRASAERDYPRMAQLEQRARAYRRAIAHGYA